MRLRDLKAALSRYEVPIVSNAQAFGESLFYEMAYRVAALSDECPMCHDGGVAVAVDGIPGCPRCLETGVVPNRDLLDRVRYPHDPAPGIEAHNERFRVAFDLIRYLFGDNR